MLETNKMKVLKKIASKIKIDRIRSQQIRESRGIKPIRWKEEEEENGTNM